MFPQRLAGTHLIQEIKQIADFLSIVQIMAVFAMNSAVTHDQFVASA